MEVRAAAPRAVSPLLRDLCASWCAEHGVAATTDSLGPNVALAVAARAGLARALLDPRRPLADGDCGGASRRDAGRQLAENSQPWITLGLVIVLALYLLLKLNSERCRVQDEKARSAEAGAQKVKLLEQEVVDWKKRYEVSQAQYPVFRREGSRGLGATSQRRVPGEALEAVLLDDEGQQTSAKRLLFSTEGPE
jgi:hypothetical protein